MTTGNTIILTRQTFVGKVMSLLLNMLSRLVITFLTKSKHLLTSVGKGVCQSYILSPYLLSYMQSTSCEMPGWMNHKLESKLPGEISTTSDMQMIPPNGRKPTTLMVGWYHPNGREPLDEDEREEWKSWFKTQHSKKLRSWHPVPSLHDR